jgi:uncharacterized protein (DUF1697 family)
MRWVVLLRAVNLGARNKVPMAQLRELLTDVGFRDVRTYVASGNVLLEGPRGRATLAKELERHVAEAFGVETTAILRKPQELAAVVDAHPFGRSTSQTHVAFLGARPAKTAVARLEAAGPGTDVVVPAGAEIYLRLRDGVQGFPLSGARIEKLLCVPATLRNWRTVTTLAELAADA